MFAQLPFPAVLWLAASGGWSFTIILQTLGGRPGPAVAPQAQDLLLRGGVGAAHIIKHLTAWRTAYPYPPPRGEAGATRTYPPKKQ